MKKLIIQLLCAEILRLQKLLNTEGKELLQEQCETSAKAMLRQGVEIQKLRAEIKELKEQLSDWKQNYHDSLQAKQRAELDFKKCFSENEKLQATNERQFEWNQENLKKIEELEKENQLIIEERNDLLLHQLANTPKIASQWKNNVKDGLPVLKIGDIIAYSCLQENRFYEFLIIEDIFIPSVDFSQLPNFDYFIIPQNATN